MATNTEKPATKAEQKKQGIVNSKSSKKQAEKALPAVKEKKEESKAPSSNENKKKDSSEEKKKTAEKAKKTEAVVNAVSLPISSKHSVAICRFIKGKKIEIAQRDLEEVVLHKKAVPMKGEIPHRKGRIMSGRYPEKASKEFIKLLKSLSANAHSSGIEDPVIAEAVSNIASRPFGRFGRIRRKRTHVRIVAVEKKNLNKTKRRKK